MYNHQLDAFIRVAELNSFAKAAGELYISTPAIIQQINLLESRCGFLLFARSNRGVKLTPAGKSLYDDAKALVQLSGDMLAKAERLAQNSHGAIRVAMSLLYKCRLLPQLVDELCQTHPDLNIELVSLPEPIQRDRLFAGLGVQYDLFEGTYGTNAWQNRCQFLQLTRAPICCAIPKHHHLAAQSKITMQDLSGETVVMLAEGISYEMDDLRKEIERVSPTVHIVDSSFYRLDTFALCELHSYLLISQAQHQDIHSNLVTVPLETYLTMPYGLMYANEPSDGVLQLIEMVRELSKQKTFSFI